MKTYLYYLYGLIFFATCISCFGHKIKLDQNIEEEVYSHIIDTLIQADNFCSYRFRTDANLELYRNDILVESNLDSLYFHDFKSTWKYSHDTLKIIGTFGSVFTSQVGFQIEYYPNNESTAFLYTRGYGEPAFSASKEDELDFNLRVPAKNWDCTLSEIPNKEKAEVFIYGHIKFESEDFYEAGKFNKGHEDRSSRNKLRSKMSIYFKANRC